MIDEQALAILKRDVGDDMFPMILEQFAIELRGKIEQLDDAFQRAELDQLAELAHSLKSTTRTLGLNGVADQVAELEQRARAADAAVLAEAADTLALCHQAARAIESRVAELS